jgi:hypothetical protein
MTTSTYCSYSRYLFSVVSRDIYSRSILFSHSLLHDVCLVARCPPLLSPPLPSPWNYLDEGQANSKPKCCWRLDQLSAAGSYVSIQMSNLFFRSPFIFLVQGLLYCARIVQSGVSCVHRALYTLTDHSHVSTAPAALLLISCLVFTWLFRRGLCNFTA